MKLRHIAATLATAFTLAGGAVAMTGTAHAATVTCRTTVTHHHSVTAVGTVSDYTLRKSGCGKNYTETESGTSRSASGAHSSFTWTKVETYPCWTKVEYRTSYTSKGTVSHTVTRSGNC